MKIKKTFARLCSVLIASCLLAGADITVNSADPGLVSPQAASQNETAPGASGFSGFNSTVLTVGVRGSYYANCQEALDRVNAIRLEACREGVRDPSNTSRKLTLNDYRPLKWSSSLEAVARQRAAEATLRTGHIRDDGGECYSLDASDLESSYEVVARNDTQDLVENINQFYEEKNAWVYKTGEKDGHYAAMIDPRNRYVGMGGFYSPECCSHTGIMCARFSFGSNTVSSDFSSPTGTVMVPIRVLSSYISAPKIVKNGSASLHLGSSALYELWSETQIGEITGKVFFIDNITWTSSNTSVAKVSNGRVTTLSMGRTTISASSSTGAYASFTLEVTAPDVTVTLDKSSLNLEPGQSYQLKATVYPKSSPYNSVTWKNSDSTVVSLSDGKITAKKAGTAVITAVCMSGKTAKCTVTVTNPPTSITLNKTKLVLGVAETAQLTATLPPNSTPGIKWTSSDSSVVTVSAGNLTAKGTGRATITAETTNGKTAVCNVQVKAAPPALSMSYSEKAIGLGETYTLTASVPSGTASATITWSSNNSKTVSVTNGKIKALAIGSATITAKTYNGKTATCSVRVREAPDTLTLDASKKIIGVGEKLTLTPSVPKGSASGSITWSSGDTSVAVVSDGVVTGKAIGTAVITAATYNGKTARCTVIVRAAPSEITLDKSSVTLGAGEKLTLEAFITNGSASDSIIWTSSDESIVTVNEGKLTAVKSGTATVTVQTFNGKKAVCEVKVKKAPSELILTQTKRIVGAGEVFTLGAITDRGSAYSIIWSTKSTDIISVQNGTVTALQQGTAVVTAKTYNGLTATCAVIVRNSPEYISLSEQAVTLGEGESFELSAVLDKSTASSVLKWTSSSPETVSVIDGELTALSQGTAYITVSTYNGMTANCTVTVKAAPEKVYISSPRDTIGMNEKLQITAMLSSESASHLEWSSSNEDILTVKQDGTVITSGEGSAVVTVRAFNGASDSCTITVMSAPESITLSSEKIYIGVGESYIINAYLSEGSASEIRRSISNTDIAVSDGNTVCGLIEGVTTLTAKTYNGKTDRCTIVVRSAPQYIELSEEQKDIGEGEEYTLTASLPKNTASANIEWFSSDESIVSVDNGKLTALSCGTAVIGVRTYNGMVDRCVINVRPAPQYFELTEKKIIIGAGESFSLDTVFSDGSASGSISWTSSTKKAAAVTDGKVTGQDTGTTLITAKAYNGVKATCSVIVRSAPEEVTLSSEKLYIGVGESYKLKASLPKGSMSALTWKTGNTDIASVQDGTVTAIQEGITVLTVKTFNGKEAKCTVIVKAEPNGVSLDSSKKTLGVGEKITLTAQLPKGAASASLKWASGNTSVAKVLSDGTVRAVGTGTTVISVRTYNGLRAAMKLTVMSAPKSISLNKTKKYLGVGESYQLKASLPQGTASDTLTWTSSDNEVASVENGKITALKNGTAVITAKAFNGVKATCKVIVMNAPEEVTLNTEEIILGEGESALLRASISEGSSSLLSWKVGNPDFASVSSNGRVKAVSAGRTRVTVKTYNGLSASCLVIVRPAPTEINITDEEITLYAGQSFNPNVTMTKNSASSLTWSTSDSSVAVVKDGTITAVSEGTAVISVFTFNGLCAECLVTVDSSDQ